MDKLIMMNQQRIKYLVLLLLAGSFLVSATGQSNLDNQIIQNTFQEFSAAANSKTYTGSAVPVFNHLEDTHGSRYLFDHWVRGTIVSMQGQTIANDSFLMNYDKISESIFLTMDRITVVEVAKKEIRSFTLEQGNEDYHFERVTLIDNKNLFQVMLKDSARSSLYKLYHTRFHKADYFNDGIHESGKNYNEYIEAPEYFILFSDRQYVVVPELTRKAIIKSFNLHPLRDKVAAFLSQYKGEESEQMLKGLVVYLDK